MTDTITLFLALLAVVAQLCVAAALVLVVAERVGPRGNRAALSVRDAVAPSALGLAFAVAAVAMAGSLYLSEGAHFPPCRLCWYQRIAMYPLVPMLAIASWRRDPGVARYAAPLALIGAAISSYHAVLERFPSLETGACEAANPCTIIWVERFGYLTIPTMALSAFALIATLLAVARTHHPRGTT